MLIILIIVVLPDGLSQINRIGTEFCKKMENPFTKPDEMPDAPTSAPPPVPIDEIITDKLIPEECDNLTRKRKISVNETIEERFHKRSVSRSMDVPDLSRCRAPSKSLLSKKEHGSLTAPTKSGMLYKKVIFLLHSLYLWMD